MPQQPETTAAAANTHSWPRWWLVGPLLITLLVGGGLVFADYWSALPDDVTAQYVGRSTCAECHAEQLERWTDSHHDLAMDHATEATVLGDFNDVEFTHHDVTSRLFRDGDRFMVHTEGPDAKMADFQVKFVLGVTPLQQYMIEFDRPAEMPADEIARLQVLRISWDTAQEKWFYLPPPDVQEKLEADDDLHWTGIAQRWNNMCADCHSTNLQKNYDVATGTYHTTYSEIDVSCEACHGPGSVHIKLARQRSLFWDRKRGYGLARLKGDRSEPQIETCAPCHARRRVVHPGFEGGEDYFNHFSTESLREGLYHADGQILDEVYVHGSFVQSKMYDKGIRCTDCHDPHTAQLKHNGNQVCVSCHTHSAGKYDSPSHHQHEPGSSGASCVACHMPETTYMEVDPRRDHSLRVPRPDLSVKLGTPNACTGCHLKTNPLGIGPRESLKDYAAWLLARSTDSAVDADLKRLDQWSQEHVEKWFGQQTTYRDRRRNPHPAELFDAARRGDERIVKPLAKLATDRSKPWIYRTTALGELTRFPGRPAADASEAALKDAVPSVRAAAVANLEGLPEETLLTMLPPLLNDPVRLVRTEAARVMSRVPIQRMRDSQRRAFESAMSELRAGLLVSNDRAAAHMTLGILHEHQGQVDEAIDAYETAIRVEPSATGPRSNLAAVLEGVAQQYEQQAVSAQRSGNREQWNTAVSNASQRRDRATKLRAAELQLLARDARLAPNNAAVQYRYGLALYLHDRQAEAEQALRRATELEPEVPDFLLALVLLYEKQGRRQLALQGARRLVDLRPEDRANVQLLRKLENPQ